MAMGPLNLPVGGNEYPSSSPAVPAHRNGVLVLLFATGESVFWTFMMPSTYAGGTLSLHGLYSMASATANNVEWRAEVEAIGDTESAAADSFDTANDTGDIAVPATAGVLDAFSLTLTNKDSVAAGDRVRVRFSRITPAGTDATGGAELHVLQLREA